MTNVDFFYRLPLYLASVKGMLFFIINATLLLRSLFFF